MGKNISPYLENKGNYNALSEPSFQKIWMKSLLFVKASQDHCFLQWVTQHVLFWPQFTWPRGSAATSTQMPSLPLGDSFPTWRHQVECESSKQESRCCSCHPLAGATQWGTAYCPFWWKERKKKAENCLPASETRLCASSVSGITFRNTVLLPYLSRREQLLIPPPQKSFWLVGTFTNF